MSTCEALRPKDRIIVALDTQDLELARFLVEQLKPYVGLLKLGLEFSTATLVQLITIPSDSDAIERLKQLRDLFDAFYPVMGGPRQLFWDGKFDDIPNTVGGAATALKPLNPAFFNVHASAGIEAIRAAVKAKVNSKVLGVTVLTSIDADECVSIFGDPPSEKVVRFCEMLVEAGANGVICSPQELDVIAQDGRFDDLIRVTPGVRSAWAAKGDQARVMTPGEAVKAGADYLVIGRPITQPPDGIKSPVVAAQMIAKEIEEALH